MSQTLLQEKVRGGKKTRSREDDKIKTSRGQKCLFWGALWCGGEDSGEKGNRGHFTLLARTL